MPLRRSNKNLAIAAGCVRVAQAIRYACDGARTRGRQAPSMVSAPGPSGAQSLYPALGGGVSFLGFDAREGDTARCHASKR